MERNCEGLILSKKGFGEGHLIINFLDSHFGKMKLVAYGAALETGLRRVNIQSGSFLEGLISSSPKTPNTYHLKDTKTILSIDHIRENLRPMGFTFFTLEIIDLLILEGDLFPYYKDLYSAFQLFEESLDEKYVLFFLAKFLSGESWLDIPEQEKLQHQTKRFINDAQQYNITFLQGKYISTPRCHELSYFFAHAVKRAINKMPHSIELLRFHEG